MLTVDVITIFPGMFTGPLNESILKRAQQKGLVTINIHNLRDFTEDVHHTTDDRPYGGGPGMVMLVEPIDKAIKHVISNSQISNPKRKILLTAANGITFTQQKAQEYQELDHLIIIAGHYEGVDQRVADYLVDESVSIGNYVLTGGELPAMVITDAVTRLIPGVLGKEESLTEESHSEPGYLEYPHYTRPENYQGHTVPDVLLSGNHAAIASWRKDQSKRK